MAANGLHGVAEGTEHYAVQLALAFGRPGPAHCGMPGFVGFLKEALLVAELFLQSSLSTLWMNFA